MAPDSIPESPAEPGGGPVAKGKSPNQLAPVGRAIRIIAGITAVSAILLIMASMVLAWPQAFGGRFSIVGVTGDAPAHDLHDGDLVIARKSDSYSPGELVAVEASRDRHPITIMQPVVGQVDAETYLVQGSFWNLDEPWPVSKESIRGAKYAVIPRGATIVSTLIRPWFVGLAVTVMVAVLLWPQRDPEDDPPVSTSDSEPLARV